MNLSDLTDDEKVALVGLIKHMVGADSDRSPEEMEEFRAIADEMGRREFDKAFQKAMQDLGTIEMALEFATVAVSREDAKELMHTVLVDLASADYVSEREREMIRRVADIWGIQTRI
jgi:uncharacterized tellurite resistance protein B-like protein